METRSYSGELKVEKRADGKPVVAGYGIVYFREGDPATEFELWDGVYERIMPGAFKSAIGRDDIRSLFNHDANFVLGRAKSKTLSLRADDTGIHYEATPPDTQAIRDQVLAPIERGDVAGSSFMFRATDVAWVTTKRGDKMIEVREVRDGILFEMGPVVFPAYSGTTTGLRSADFAEARSSWESMCKERTERAACNEAEAVRVQARMMEVG